MPKNTSAERQRRYMEPRKQINFSLTDDQVAEVNRVRKPGEDYANFARRVVLDYARRGKDNLVRK